MGFEEEKILLSREELQAKFGWEEYVSIFAMLAMSTAIGIYFWWCGQKNNSEFLLGGKSMGILPMSLSLLAR
jgi:Na+/proline symporter